MCSPPRPLCRVPARVVPWLSPVLGTMLSQRWRAHASLQRKFYLSSKRLQLLCRGGPLSALLLAANRVSPQTKTFNKI
jgi:hypothetical protein